MAKAFFALRAKKELFTLFVLILGHFWCAVGTSVMFSSNLSNDTEGVDTGLDQVMPGCQGPSWDVGDAGDVVPERVHSEIPLTQLLSYPAGTAGRGETQEPGHGLTEFCLVQSSRSRQGEHPAMAQLV